KPGYSSDCAGLGMALIGIPLSDATSSLSTEARRGRASIENSRHHQHVLSVGFSTYFANDESNVSSLQHATCLVSAILTQIVWDVLERAKGAGDADVIAACRCILAGHGDAADMRLVLAFAA